MLESLTLANLLALLNANIDISLLKEEGQETDIDKLYTTKEIREQFYASSAKMLDVLTNLGFDVHKALTR